MVVMVEVVHGEDKVDLYVEFLAVEDADEPGEVLNLELLRVFHSDGWEVRNIISQRYIESRLRGESGIKLFCVLGEGIGYWVFC